MGVEEHRAKMTQAGERGERSSGIREPWTNQVVGTKNESMVRGHERNTENIARGQTRPDMKHLQLAINTP